jgi:DNA-binding NarL/FixJ family response regulator
MSTIRVLVVDDYEPFRRFICATLGKKAELLIVGEVSDGLEAVHRAEELRPDLIVLDIGLPNLNGIEAARRIRKLSPNSKILFVSQESSADAVQAALGLGALGYVVKAHAGKELLAAVEAVLEGRQFIGGGLSSEHFRVGSDSRPLDDLCANKAVPSLAPKNAEITRSHKVEFYPDDANLVVGFCRFIEAVLKAGKAVIVASTELHQKNLLRGLQKHGVNVSAAMEQGRYLFLDVAEILSSFMESDVPNRERFFKVVGALIEQAAETTAGQQSKVAICGECASILWAQGKADAAIEVEQLCNQLSRRYEMNILCGFSLSSFYREEDKQLFQRICSEY